MHLLLAQDAADVRDDEAIDLGQQPADIVFLSFADTELALLSAAAGQANVPSLRLANLALLRHPMSVDLYLEKTVAAAKLVIVRLIGGRSYWSYGVEQLTLLAASRNLQLVFLPGDDRRDEELERASSVSREELQRLHAYLIEGGLENARAFLSHAQFLLDPTVVSPNPCPLPKADFYRLPGPARSEREIALIVFYRALVQADDLAPVDALIEALETQGIECAALFVSSLRIPEIGSLMTGLQERHAIGVVLNMTGFALAGTSGATDDPLRLPDCPILQAVLSSDSEAGWQAGQRGLAPRDLAMAVALPEIDGRILAGAVSFKAAGETDPCTQYRPIKHHPRADRVERIARTARAWLQLRAKPRKERKLAVVLGNYPVRDGRLANAVGLDSPASLICILEALATAGYVIQDAPRSTAELMDQLRAGVTNDAGRLGGRLIRVRLKLDAYQAWLARLPKEAVAAVEARWGDAATDPFVVDSSFALPVLPLGNLIVGLQPSRAPGLDPDLTFHDQNLVPPHAYLAFHAWLQMAFMPDAIIHLGKHGSLEWLPGKALALSAECWPDILLDSIPVLYPFIVNDPGEGAQAKRRLGAVVIDHLTPPLGQAGTAETLLPLERLLDEYAQAQSLDPPRALRLAKEIFDFAHSSGLSRDLGLGTGQDPQSLVTLDRHLCELKELQIRDGLHIFGQIPDAPRRASLLLSLSGRGGGLVEALVADLGLASADPLHADPAAPWNGPRPALLARLLPTPWRLTGHTRERLHHLAEALIAGTVTAPADWQRTRQALLAIERDIAPLLEASAKDEMANLLRGLDGRFVLAGPSGAPSRGRLDVLPTGRNFYSVDTRAVPTTSAWKSGWASASAVIDRYLQMNGDWPRQIALSIWGSANMRTGGDDIAQALAFMGCRPVWDTKSARVTGVEILPLAVLGRPRVDVLMRISGFFRDAFPAQIALLDDAIRAVARLDEPTDQNPLAAASREVSRALEADGMSAADAMRMASFRIFGSAPAAYGTGIQDTVDRDLWQDESELAARFLAHGSFAYGRGHDGVLQEALLAQRLKSTQLVLQNQDNREHDLLDSDGYYQFEGGLALSVRELSGQQPLILHADHADASGLRLRTLKEELSLVLRGRATNPKWLRGVMRHGYKGASEIAATVDFLYAFAATSGEVQSHHFDLLFDAYLQDEEVRSFIGLANADALHEIAQRFKQAMARGYWQPRRNRAPLLLDELSSDSC